MYSSTAGAAAGAGSVGAGAGVAAAAAGVGLSERLRRLQIVHELYARYAARLREELSKRELRMQPLDMWNVLKKLQPLRVNPPKEYKALFASQRACRPNVQTAPAAAVFTTGCVVLDDAPDSVMRHFNIMAMESLLEDVATCACKD
jgi:hypothetical protein